jgi:hypothetical protein
LNLSAAVHSHSDNKESLEPEQSLLFSQMIKTYGSITMATKKLWLTTNIIVSQLLELW